MAGGEGYVVPFGIFGEELADSRRAFAGDSRPDGLEKSEAFEAVVPFGGILGISAENHARDAGVGRLLDHLFHGLHSAAVGVGGAHEGGAVHHIVDRMDQTVFKGDHQRDGLHHRTGLVGEHGAVEGLAVGSVLEQLDVGYGLDFAGLDLHQDGCAPFGAGFGADVVELLFEHVLQVDVDGGVDVVAAHGRSRHPVGDAVGEGHFLGQAGLAVKEGVEVFFKTGIAVDLVAVGGLVDAADAAVGHAPEGIHPDVALGGVDGDPRSLSGEVAQEGEVADAVEILHALLLGDHEGTLPDAVGLLEFAFEFGMPGIFFEGVGRSRRYVGTARIIDVERVGKGVDLRPGDGRQVFYLVVAQVELDVVDAQVAGKYVAVVGENVPPFGRNGVDGRELAAGPVVPCVGLHHCRGEEFPQQQYGEYDKSYRYDAVAEKNVCLVVLLCHILPLIFCLSVT